MIATVGMTGGPGKGARVGVVAGAGAGAGAGTDLELEGTRDPVLSFEATYPPVPRIGFGPSGRGVAGDGV